MNEDRSFYKNLNAFREFSQLTGDAPFISVPDSWNVLITDIKGSTKAVKEGRSKDINLIGAASITCVLNAAEANEIPFVFGGDGATLLIPAHLLELVIQELKGLQDLAKKSFKLDLRVGYISMAELRKLGADLQLAKYELSPGNYTAQFKGGAMVLAEDMIKKSKPAGATVVQSSGKDIAPHLEGLSCRLMPIESRNGIILSILAKPQGPRADEILKEILFELKTILNGDFLSARPISNQQMRWKWPTAAIFSEIKIQNKSRASFYQFFGISLRGFLTMMALSFDIPIGLFKPKVYKTELISNSDFTKFDETLRMVIDCSLAQATKIEELLTIQRQKNGIAFGLHRSSKALMTCMVKSATSNQHIHFIDGADGGYTLAAANMKASENQN